MKKMMRFSLLLLLISATISSCHKTPKQTQYIPKDATVVFSVNAANLQSKLAKSNINMDSLFNSLRDTNSISSSAGIKSWQDLKSSGIDWEKNIYVFVSSTGSVMNGLTSSTGVVAAMQSQSDFENFLKKQEPNISIKKSNDYSYAVLKNGTAIGWNGDIIIVSNVSSSRAEFQSAPNTYSNNDTAAQKQLATLFSQKEEESVASISQFNDMMSENADMQFWTNSNSSLATIPMIGMTKASDLFKDSYTAGNIFFDDGKVTMKTKSYVGKDLKNILDKYKSQSVDLKMIDNYPAPINGFTAFSFNPQIVGDIVKYVGFDATANQYFQQMGFTLDDVLRAFKGDFAFVVSDIAVKEAPNEFAPGETIKKPTARFIFNATIGDKAAYDKIVSALAAKGLMVQKNGQYVPAQMEGYAFNADNKNLIVASDDALLQQYKAGNSNKTGVPPTVMNNEGKAGVFYVNINSIINAFSNVTQGTDGTTYPQTTIVFNSAKQTFKEASGSWSNFDGNSVSGSFELRTMNDKENSLATLVKFFSTVAQNEKLKQNNFGSGDSLHLSHPMMPNIDSSK